MSNRTGNTTRQVQNEPIINDEDLGLDDFAERSERSETDSVGGTSKGASSLQVELRPSPMRK